MLDTTAIKRSYEEVHWTTRISSNHVECVVQLDDEWMVNSAQYAPLCASVHFLLSRDQTCLLQHLHVWGPEMGVASMLIWSVRE